MPPMKTATRIDYTSKLTGFHHLKQFDQTSIDLIRSSADKKMIVIVDEGFALPAPTPHIVSDHINLTGDNPLVGPNPAGGPRFPVINNVYLKVIDTLDPKKTLPLNNPLGAFPLGVAAGVQHGVTPDDDDIATIRKMGGEFYCYNIIPAMIVAAHIGLKVFAIVVPHGERLDPDTAKYLKGD